ncbi:MAG TPA: T9SS type A sorting domain-containing protein, partial [Bacteroidales bacterium]|nr:T9SS type A sorting domain-containing protein [Bacteroidales bacterium]
DIVLGVEEAHNSDLIVYPNPTSGVLYLYNSVFEKVEVYDSFGQLVIAKTNTDQIDLSSLANGNYFVKAINNEIVITKQIIVSK